MFTNGYVRKFITCITLAAFIILNTGSGNALTITEGPALPVPGSLVKSSPAFIPPLLKGIAVDVNNPFTFNFILDTGESSLNADDLESEANKLIRYFLASLTIPENDLWVNLSPFEKDRIIPDALSATEMGRDLLAQDYILKQITASLIYPESSTGKKFWDKVYQRAYDQYGATDIPTDTFNKVWVIPNNKAVIYEKGTKAFIVEAKLKVMLESDYTALTNRQDGDSHPILEPSQELSQQILREVIVPLLEKEINEGAHFSPLRQVYTSLILAKWYKETLKNSILNREYSNQKKVNGIDLADKDSKQAIYERYLETFKLGAFNYVKEEYDTHSQETLPRKYFSGGFDLARKVKIERALTLPNRDSRPVGTFMEVAGTLEESVPEATERRQIARRVPYDQRKSVQRKSQTRALAATIFEKERWADTLSQSLRALAISKKNLTYVINQLNHDPLGKILDLKDGAGIVVFRRTGTASGQTSLKNFNSLFGDENNNIIIAETQAQNKQLMTQNGFISSPGDVIGSTYKDMTFMTNPELINTRQLNNVKESITRNIFTFIRTNEHLKHTAAGINFAEDLLDFGVSRLDQSDEEDPLQLARNKVLAVITANMAIAMGRIGLRSGLFNEADDPFLFRPVNLIAAVQHHALLRNELLTAQINIFKPEGTIPLLQENIKKLLRQQLSWEDLADDPELTDLKNIFLTQELYLKTQEYYNWLGLVDYIKQWQIDFAKAYAHSQKISSVKAQLQSIRNSMNDTETRSDPNLKNLLRTAEELINNDPKLPSSESASKVMSELSVYTQAAKSENLGLIFVDIINMSGKNATELEILMANLNDLFKQADYNYATLKGTENAINTMNNLLLSAADNVTRSFQDNIQKIERLLAEKNIPVSFIKIGGDEITIGVQNYEQLTPALMATIQQITQGRVAASHAIKYFKKQFAERKTLYIKRKNIQSTADLNNWMAFAALFLSGEADIVYIKSQNDRVIVIKDINGISREYPLDANDSTDGRAITDIRDTAQVVDDVGGIDLNPSQFSLERQGQGVALNWAADTTNMNTRVIDGLTPVIITIQRMNDQALRW